ncbi:MAG: Response regulator rcp1 [Candidatus Aerophobetes bacterium ADurb.Bin490]|nr:MAG: Response regulator rcp1 [Candidatus Aerophobetes bacterium ADurb.Bin490]HPI02762.1 response regulator [Candidatus Goldiibacteriota bacterium]HPN63679.1 response regulator [Candidatus Goldiibacteriota bacterium]HRQ44508.1 response regulator [Candidatus Goldiibacteriota bacterium]
MIKPKVLLVEDKESDVRLVKEAFSILNIETDLNAVYDGEEALNYIFKKGKYASAQTPDIVIMDIKMPKKNGREVLKEIRENSSTKDITVFMLTNSDAKEDILDSYEHRANSYMTKPLELSEFVEIIKYINEIWLKKTGRN